MTEETEIVHVPYSGDKGWIGVDLDRTLAIYHGKVDGVYDPMRIGSPIPRMVARIKGWLAEGYEVRIFTARVGGFNLEEGSGIIARAMVADNIQNWLENEAGLPRLAVTNEKDMDTCQIWDDIAVGVVRNTGTPHAEFLQKQVDELAEWITENLPHSIKGEGAIGTALTWMKETRNQMLSMAGAG